MRKKILAAFFIFVSIALASSNAFATEQKPESLIYKGEKLWLYDTPLEAYFNDQHPRPNFSKLSNQSCSAQWRGYHGTWEVKEGCLFLIKLQGPCREENAPDMFMPVIFPAEKPPIKATWVSGAMHALYNKKMLELKFDKGQLISEEVKEWPPSKYNYQFAYEYWMHEENK